MALMPLRREHSRLLVLAGVVVFVYLCYFLAEQHDMIPNSIGNRWKPIKHTNYSLDYAHNEPYANTELPSSGHLAGSSTAFIPPGATRPGRLALTDRQTTIPSTPLESNPSVKVAAQTHGFNMFNKLYLRDRTFYIVTDDRNSFPETSYIVKKIGYTLEDDTIDLSDKFLQFITPSLAKEVLGGHATIVPGTSMFITDPTIMISHYYHFWGEIVMGAWRIYSTLALGKSGDLESLPFPSRWIMPFVDTDAGWRDRASLNGPLMRLAFPDTVIERSDLWKDWKRTGTTIVFDRAMLINRDSAHESPLSNEYFKMAGGTMNVTVPERFWEPVRQSLTNRLFGYIPHVDDNGTPLAPPHFKDGLSSSHNLNAKSLKPIVTYITRQHSGRRLADGAHERLVAALRGLEKDGVCILRIPAMEDLTLNEQIAEIASSTIMVGVHGNGLTHELFMPPSLRSAVIELQVPNSYGFDYELVARNMGHKHYMVLNDTVLTYPSGTTHKGVNFPADFHSSTIQVDAQIVVDIIRKRLTQPPSQVEP